MLDCCKHSVHFVNIVNANGVLVSIWHIERLFSYYAERYIVRKIVTAVTCNIMFQLVEDVGWLKTHGMRP